MHLKYCSITGADDAVDVDDLSALAEKHPFAEWAILLLPDHAGKPRFPSTGWIETFTKEYRGLHTAMHLCGQALLNFIAGDEETLELMSGFDRIQLNLKFGDIEGKYDPAALIDRIRSSPRWDFIIQYGKDKNGLLPFLDGIANHAVLFDESAGRGISPESWEAPLKGHFCGYAGGLTPDNLAHNLKMIAHAAAGQTTWIDMESGVRTKDVFDLEKVRRVLEIAAPYAR